MQFNKIRARAKFFSRREQSREWNPGGSILPVVVAVVVVGWVLNPEAQSPGQGVKPAQRKTIKRACVHKGYAPVFRHTHTHTLAHIAHTDIYIWVLCNSRHIGSPFGCLLCLPSVVNLAIPAFNYLINMKMQQQTLQATPQHPAES